MTNTTFVTAFYDLKRNGYKYTKSTEEYIIYFKNLSSINNHIVIFTTPNYSSLIKSIRGDKPTTVIEYDIFSEFVSLNCKIKSIHNTVKYKNIVNHTLHRNMEYCLSEYSLINYLKSFFVWISVFKNLVKTEYVGWIDFGYVRDVNHSYKSLNFNGSDKHIHTFSLNQMPNIDDINIYDIMTNNIVNIIGGCFVINKNFAEHTWNMVRDGLFELVDMGLVDDDQTLMMYLYKKYPEKFFNTILPNQGWFSALDNFENI